MRGFAAGLGFRARGGPAQLAVWPLLIARDFGASLHTKLP
jgi:hypothetical protein